MHKQAQLSSLADYWPRDEVVKPLPHEVLRVVRVGSMLNRAPRKLVRGRGERLNPSVKPTVKPISHTSRRTAKGGGRVIRPQNWRVYGSF